MTYDQAVNFLYDREKFGWKLELHRMEKLLEELDNPHKKLRCIHIAGTNGKGSVAAMLESIYRFSSYKTGLFTSPHLVDVRERIRVNGKKINKPDFAKFIVKIIPVLEKYECTFFETTTVLAFIYFVEQKVDIALVEVGLGGRLDATNVVDPLLSIITSISFDHTEHLGSTIADITREKAGIIKQSRPCLIGNLPVEAKAIINTICIEKNCELYQSNQIELNKLKEQLGRTSIKIVNPYSFKFTLPFNGNHQMQNAEIALTACQLLDRQGLGINKQSIQRGLENVKWPARFQVVRKNPTVIMDVAHNEASIFQLIELIKQFFSKKRVFIVLGLLKDKNVDQIADHLKKLQPIIQPVAPLTSRALAANKLKNILKNKNIKVFPAKTVSQGLKYCLKKADQNDIVCITGSHYVVGEAMSAIKSLTN